MGLEGKQGSIERRFKLHHHRKTLIEVKQRLHSAFIFGFVACLYSSVSHQMSKKTCQFVFSILFAFLCVLNFICLRKIYLHFIIMGMQTKCKRLIEVKQRLHSTFILGFVACLYHSVSQIRWARSVNLCSQFVCLLKIYHHGDANQVSASKQ